MVNHLVFTLQEGSIGHDVVIKPVPYGLINKENPEGSRTHHIVYKRKVETSDHLSDFGKCHTLFIRCHQFSLALQLIIVSCLAFMEPDRLQKRYRNKRSSGSTVSERSKRAIPHIIYPEILVIVDYDGYRLHGGDNTQVSGRWILWTTQINWLIVRLFQIKRYFVSFWNGVDLRYRLLKGPRIRISIAGIIISRVSWYCAEPQPFCHNSCEWRYSMIDAISSLHGLPIVSAILDKSSTSVIICIVQRDARSLLENLHARPAKLIPNLMIRDGNAKRTAAEAN